MGTVNSGPMRNPANLALVLILTGLSGVLDARGFVYAARAWPDGSLDLRMAAIAIVAFIGGLSCYVLAVRFMHGLGVSSVAIQTGIWFIVTAVGVSVMDGSIANWTRTQQLVAIAVTLGIGWLAATTAAPKI
jgi:hypothetical protein